MLSKPADFELYLTGIFLEGFFYGLYSGTFSMYLQYHWTSRKETKKSQNIIFYSICALYVSSTAVFVCDLAETLTVAFQVTASALIRIDLIQTTSFACCDFVAQFILIYRCWIVWSRNIRVVIVPTLLAFAFLGTWLAGSSSLYISSGMIFTAYWAYDISLLALALSLTVNALVTGLIIFRIFKVFQEVKTALHDQTLGVGDGRKLRQIIFILIESGMALFSIQLARIVATIFQTGSVAFAALNIIGSIHVMLTGITPTIILVRISMGLSFHDEKSMEEIAVGSLRFGSDHLNSVPDIGSVGSLRVGQDSRDEDIVEVRRSNDIEVVDR